MYSIGLDLPQRQHHSFRCVFQLTYTAVLRYGGGPSTNQQQQQVSLLSNLSSLCWLSSHSQIICSYIYVWLWLSGQRYWMEFDFFGKSLPCARLPQLLGFFDNVVVESWRILKFRSWLILWIVSVWMAKTKMIRWFHLYELKIKNLIKTHNER